MNDDNRKDLFDEEFEKKQSEYRPTTEDEGWSEYKKASEQPKQKKPRSKSVTVILCCLVLICTFALGIGCAKYYYVEYGMLSDVLALIQENYLFDYDEDKLYFDAAKGIANGLDAYTRMLDPVEYYELMNAEDSEMYGIGYELSDDGWGFYTVLPSSPADRAISADGNHIGLRKGDKLVSMNGIPITASTTTAELNAITDETGVVDFVVNRDGETIAFNDVTRILYEARYVEYYYVDESGNIRTNMDYYKYVGEVLYSNYAENGVELTAAVQDPSYYPHYDAYSLDKIDSTKIGYIKFHEFSYTNAEMGSFYASDFEEAMNEFKSAYNQKGKMVLDLNDNGGGYNAYCEQVASYFLYDGTPDETLKLYRMKDKNGVVISSSNVRTKYASYFDTTAVEPQFALLTNGNSASASEMLTGAVLTYGTGIQIGTQTYGKGISQTVVPVKTVEIDYNGSKVASAYAFYFTFGFFYTPDVADSTSPYNNYCNQSDTDGDGVIGEGESAKGYMPTEGNVFESLADQLARANVLFGGQ